MVNQEKSFENKGQNPELMVGTQFALGPYEVTKEEIIEFAAEFDPAPFHLDEEAGEASMLGKLSASGWHTCAMAMRMICDAIILDSTSQGSPGIEDCKWQSPVFAGDILSGTATIASARQSKSLPNITIYEFFYEITKQDKTPVLSMKNFGMFKNGDTDND